MKQRIIFLIPSKEKEYLIHKAGITNCVLEQINKKLKRSM